ncbi:MAG: hypothetical protein ACPG8W_22660 [Candidatus Promineifilaceae bacterium]
MPILLFPNLAIAQLEQPERSPDAVITPTITLVDEVVHADMKRLGVNLGVHNQYGASQLLKNFIVNPGFEAGEFASLVIPHNGATADQIQADNYFGPWDRDLILYYGQPAGFWDDADYEVIYGSALSESGKVLSFTYDSNLATYHLDGMGSPPSSNDVIAFRKTLTQTAAGAPVKDTQMADTSEVRPNSPGTQSLKLLPAVPGANWDFSYRYFMDSYWATGGDTSARKLLIVEGEWTLSFWAKTISNTESLNVQFLRRAAGNPFESAFINTAIPITNSWQLYTHTFTVAPGGDPIDGYTDSDPHPLLELNLFLESNSNPIWIDDMSLTRAVDDNPTVFTNVVVDMLKAAKPGIIRNWGEGVLGNTLDNQLAEPFARKTSGYAPDKNVAQLFHYSLHDFLVLAQEIGSEPWYVTAPTWTDAEMENLAAYLAAPVSSGHPYALKRAALGQSDPWTDVFPKIHVEFGNEMWGQGYGSDPFWGATVRGGFRLGAIANQRFEAFKASAYWDSAEFNFIIGGQHGYPPQNSQIQANSTAHHSVALAPYFGELDSWNSDEEMYLPLYARANEDVTAGKVYSTFNILKDNSRDTELSIYEINFHTTVGTAPNATRNDFVTGLNGGLALPLYMLTYARDLGVRNQAAFQLAQFSKSVWINDTRSAEPAWYQERLAKQSPNPSDTPARGVNGYNEFVRVWGLMHDLETAQRKRPTMLGLEITNAAIQGDMIRSVVTDSPVYTQPPLNGVATTMTMPYIDAFTFKDGFSYSMLAFNLHLSDSQTVTLDLTHIPMPNGTMHILTADSVHDDNEDSTMISMTTQALIMSEDMQVTLPANSMVLLSWDYGTPVSVVQVSSSYTTKTYSLTLLLLLTVCVTMTAALGWQRQRERNF